MAESRIANVERDVQDLKVEVRDMRRDIGAIREKLFDGISDTLDDLREKLPQLMTREEHKEMNDANNGGKKPKRLEKLTVILGIAIGLQTLGVPEMIRDALVHWLGIG